MTARQRSADKRPAAMPQGAIAMHSEGKKPEEEEPGSAWMNIGKVIFLIAVLVAAWFVLERLMGSK